MGTGKNFTHSQLWALADLIFPPQCAGCGKPGTRWCKKCSENIEPLPLPACEKCGEPLSHNRDTLCRRCRKNQPVFEKVHILGSFSEPLRSALLRLKYYGDQAIGENLAADLADFLVERDVNAEVVIPIPISAKKSQERGYNQVECIAKPLAGMLDLEFDRLSLIQLKENRSQVGLSEHERRENVRDVFMMVGEKLRGKRVLLIDDTTTTGATIDFASRALMAGGASSVVCAVVAKALIQNLNDAMINIEHPNPSRM